MSELLNQQSKRTMALKYLVENFEYCLIPQSHIEQDTRGSSRAGKAIAVALSLLITRLAVNEIWSTQLEKCVSNHSRVLGQRINAHHKLWSCS